jgi:2-oxoglutarate dehydrogenase complex dehydrogenase (E1) component-like enzyme
LNSGAFDFVYPRLVRIARELGLNESIEYVGRRALATTAVGSSELHKKESAELTEWIKKLIL